MKKILLNLLFVIVSITSISSSTLSNNELSWKYKYDDAGRRVQMTSPGGISTSINYEVDNQQPDLVLKMIKQTDGMGKVEFLFDKSGRKVSMRDDNGNTRYEFDETGELSKMNYSVGNSKSAIEFNKGLVSKIIGFNKEVTLFSYYDENEKEGLLKSIIANNNSFKYEYTPENYLSSVKVNENYAMEMKYDESGRVIEFLKKRVE